MGGTQFSRNGRISSGDQWKNHAGAKVLPLQSKARRADLCASRSRSLGRGKQTPLGHGCLFSRGSEPSSGRLRRRKFGDAAQASLKLTETRENKKTGNKGQNAQRQLGSSLPTEIIGGRTKGNLDAFALAYTRGYFNGWSTGTAMTNDPTILTTNQFGLVNSNDYVVSYDVTCCSCGNQCGYLSGGYDRSNPEREFYSRWDT